MEGPRGQTGLTKAALAETGSKLLGCLGGIMLLAGFVLLGARLIGYVTWSAVLPDISTMDGATPTGATLLIVRAGDTARVIFYRGESLEGLWRSPGFVLSLDGYSETIPISGANGPGWANTVLTTNRGRSLTYDVSGSFVIPDLPGERPMRVNGLITGEITYPYDPLGGLPTTAQHQFVEMRQDVSVPVLLELITAGDTSTQTSLESLNRFDRSENGEMTQAMAIGLAVLLVAGGLAYVTGRVQEGLEARAGKP